MPRRPTDFFAVQMPIDVPSGGTPPPTPRPLSRRALGQTLARLVWENLSDDLADPDFDAVLSSIGVSSTHGIPGPRAFEELLIFHLWVQTRTVEVALHGRAADDEIRDVLDHMHRAVFEDMVENGTPRLQVAVFEERAVNRYTEYHREAKAPKEGLGAVVVRHLAGTNRPSPERAARFVTTRALEASHPLRDYLDEIELEG